MNVCLLTTGQPSTDPRLVKEADALAAVGYTVVVIAAYWAPWAAELDAVLLANRPWRCIYVGGNPRTAAIAYLWTRLRYGLALRALPRFHWSRLIGRFALARPSWELERAARRVRAALYVAHNLGALPAAVNAARKTGVRVVFDAEDFHSGMRPVEREPSALDRLVEHVESLYLPRCDFVTASSPAIADAYQRKYGIVRPTPILNVFPLAMRPATFRSTDSNRRVTLYWFSQTIGPGRGLEDVVAAVARAPGDEVELHVRGAWQQGYEARLRQFVGSLGLQQERLLWHPPAAADEMVRLAAQMDIGVAVEPGSSENNCLALSNKLLTYLLAGNAVIATETVGQIPVARQVGYASTLYRPGDVAALAESIRRWTEDRPALDLARRTAWDWGTRVYNWDSEKERFLTLVNGVLDPRR